MNAQNSTRSPFMFHYSPSLQVGRQTTRKLRGTSATPPGNHGQFLGLGPTKRKVGHFAVPGRHLCQLQYIVAFPLPPRPISPTAPVKAHMPRKNRHMCSFKYAPMPFLELHICLKVFCMPRGHHRSHLARLSSSLPNANRVDCCE